MKGQRTRGSWRKKQLAKSSWSRCITCGTRSKRAIRKTAYPRYYKTTTKTPIDGRAIPVTNLVRLSKILLLANQVDLSHSLLTTDAGNSRRLGRQSLRTFDKCCNFRDDHYYLVKWNRFWTWSSHCDVIVTPCRHHIGIRVKRSGTEGNCGAMVISSRLYSLHIPRID